MGKAIVSVQKKAGTEEDAKAAAEQLRSCRETTEITEITKTFTTAKKTKAGQARFVIFMCLSRSFRNLGLSEAAEKILKGDIVKLAQFIDKGTKGKQKLYVFH